MQLSPLMFWVNLYFANTNAVYLLLRLHVKGASPGMVTTWLWLCGAGPLPWCAFYFFLLSNSLFICGDTNLPPSCGTCPGMSIGIVCHTMECLPGLPRLVLSWGCAVLPTNRRIIPGVNLALRMPANRGISSWNAPQQQCAYAAKVAIN